MKSGIFDAVRNYPDSAAAVRYAALVGLDDVKARLEKEAASLLRPDLLETWSKTFHGKSISALDVLSRRPRLFIFAGDVGTGKTELATTFGDTLARSGKFEVQLFPLSLRSRGTGAVGEMTTLISTAFAELRAHAPRPRGGKPTSAVILLIDEADALAQSREASQMHHEDRAGVNALVRGIDDISEDRLLCITVMCTNRLSALDPAVRRRAAAIFDFERPTQALRERLLQSTLGDVGLSTSDIHAVAEALGDRSVGYGCTYSDIVQRYVPALILAAYPSGAISQQLALEVAQGIKATPPFRQEI